MTPSTPQRPVPVVIICIYQFARVLLTLAALAFAYAMHAVNPELFHPQTQVWVTLATWVGIALSMAAIITLWMLRRAAFYIFLAKLLLGIGLLIHSMVRPVHLVVGVGHIGPGQPGTDRLSPNASDTPMERPMRPRREGTARYIGYGIAIFFLLIEGVIVGYCYVLLIAPRKPALQDPGSAQ